MRDHLKLHLVVLAWGFTAILGKLINLPAAEVVVWRTFFATLGLWGLAALLRVSVKVDWRIAVQLLATGFLIGGHWLLFFLAGKVSNATISVAGLPTTIVWCCLLERVLLPGKRLRWFEIGMGILMVGAVWLILRFEVRYSLGFILSLLSALVGSLFAVLNAQFAQRHHFSVISFYQMGGGCIASLCALPFFEGVKWPAWSDLGWLLVLALICTVYAYTAYVELLRRLSVFTINLVYNLEPLYGIVLAALILREHHDLSLHFYAGTSVILLSVMAYPFIQRREKAV
ncbi:MAG: DMT family transporter [Verrucomicrobiales bacterium]